MGAPYFCYVLSERLSRILPRPHAYRLGEFIAWWVYRTSRKERTSVLHNLLAALSASHSPQEIEKSVLESYRNFGRYCVDLLYDGRWSKEDLVARTEFVNLSLIDAALEHKRGLILITAHLGNWELGSMALAAKGYPLSIVVKDHPDPRVSRMFNKRRFSSGLKVIPTGFSLRRCVKALRENKIVGITGDRLYASPGVSVRFFERWVRLPRGPFFLSRKTGAPMVVCAMVPREDGEGYRVSFTETSSEVTNDLLRSDVDGYQRVASVLESVIRQYPRYWYCFEKLREEHGETPRPGLCGGDHSAARRAAGGAPRPALPRGESSP